MSIDKGAITVFVGPSGCGKTTSLRMINRMVEPTSGTITVDGADVTSMPAAQLRRSMGYVMQSSGLMPHRSVLDNIATVPRLNGVSKADARKRAQELLDVVGLASSLGKRYPSQLSGGQQQRVGVARALAADPPGAAHGRALQRRGPGGPRRTPAGAPPAPAGPGQDHRLRHPRHRRGHRPGRQSGRVRRRRQAGAVRRAGGDPAGPGERVRGLLRGPRPRVPAPCVQPRPTASPSTPSPRSRPTAQGGAAAPTNGSWWSTTRSGPWAGPGPAAHRSRPAMVPGGSLFRQGGHAPPGPGRGPVLALGPWRRRGRRRPGGRSHRGRRSPRRHRVGPQRPARRRSDGVVPGQQRGGLQRSPASTSSWPSCRWCSGC